MGLLFSHIQTLLVLLSNFPQNYLKLFFHSFTGGIFCISWSNLAWRVVGFIASLGLLFSYIQTTF